LLAAGREGKATIRYVVDESGRVAQAVVGDASSPEFGQALLAAIEQFRYEPAVKGGRPSLALQAFSQEFRRDDAYQLVSDDDLRLLRREQKKPETIVRLGDLDAPLQPISQRPPRAPLALDGNRQAGNATIEFLVDEEGRARLPRIVKASDDRFGYAAMQAIASWRFEPPTRGGRAVVVRAILPVNFAAPRGAAAPESK
jgi:TonB family protein